jgi:membrane protein
MASSRDKDTNLLMAVVGIFMLLFGATGVFCQLQDSLNTIWEVKAKPGRGLWNFIRHRLLSLGMVLGIGFLLLVSMVLSTALSAFTDKLGSALSVTGVIAHFIDLIVSMGITALLFAAIFKFLPDVKVEWRHVWVGSVVTALLFALGKHLLGLYLGQESTESTYGAAGSVVIILLWFYYASIILFFGAEFTQVYARRTGSKIVPNDYAVPVSDKQRAQEGLSGEKVAPDHPPARIASPPVLLREDLSPTPPQWQTVWMFVGVMIITGLLAGASLRRRLPS